ncbi:MAG: molybdopterin-binding protein [Pseudomonadota bacterium]
MTDAVTAAVLVIGDEILSGRTRDINVQQIAEFLGPLGVQVKEARVVGDDQDRIVAALNALRADYDYVFTTGGIGPTHDDITADAIAAAFGVSAAENPEALAIITERYRETGVELTPARRRMARTPEGAVLVANPVSGAPGFQMENVFTLAGVPSIVRGMLEDIGPRLKTGAVVHTVTVRGQNLREGEIAEALGKLAEATPGVSLGSYPWFTGQGYGAHLVARSTDAAALDGVKAALVEIVEGQGSAAEVVDG